MNTNAVNEYVQVAEDALKSLGNLSNEALCCVAVAVVCYALKMILTNGLARHRKYIPVVAILFVGPFINWALWHTPLADNAEVSHEVSNVWVGKLIYGALYAFVTWTVYETVLKPLSKKLFGKQMLDTETEIIEKPKAGDSGKD